MNQSARPMNEFRVNTMQSKAINTRVMWMLVTWSLLLPGNVDRLYGQPATPPEVSVPAVSRETDNGSEEGLIPTKSLLGMIREGGVLMIPIGFCSFVLLVFVFERSVSLRRGRVIPRPFVRRFLEQLRAGQLTRDDALRLCEENKSPVAEVFGAAVRKWGRPSVEIEQAIIDTGERVTNELRRYIRLFNAISTISPLLGVLGTVFGMISAFNSIVHSQAMGRAELLAGGIAMALLTTAAGLCVAIPALIAYLYFISRVDRLIIMIDAFGQQVVDMISAEAQTSRAAGGRGKAA
jgi:biopolymer transport protein ExbB